MLTIIIRLFQLIGTLLLIGVITGCFMVCYAVVYVKTVVMPQTYLRLEDYAMNENSVIYYQDKSTGMLVELQTLSGEENRELIEYDQIPEDLINAIIAVEDKRFPTHNGVDWRRTASGLLRMFTGGNIQGGSTITQQSIKNATGRNDVTVNRKILEIFSALELENNYTKKDIITFYLNYIYLGNRCYGVQAASKYYFGKDVWDLSLAECASLAGITNNPSLYAPYGVVDVVRYQCQNPECKLYSLTKDDVCEYCGAEHSYDNGSVWTNREFNKARQETILKLMADPEISPDGAYITEAERDAAIAQPLVFKRDLQAVPDDDDANDADTKTSSALYSWYVEEVITEAIEALVEETGMSPAMCEQRVLNGGLSIICAYDPEAQSAVDTVFNDRSNLDQVSSKTGQRLMSAISVVDNSTGYVVAL
ncbi:MAG: transglycosylase domain-containing protein, partial [Oscillospiraceae bacterium]|nr:transglycosylase domain-containing protein [Oscillospiraceae bacterium]